MSRTKRVQGGFLGCLGRARGWTGRSLWVTSDSGHSDSMKYGLIAHSEREHEHLWALSETFLPLTFPNYGFVCPLQALSQVPCAFAVEVQM